MDNSNQNFPYGEQPQQPNNFGNPYGQQVNSYQQGMQSQQSNFGNAYNQQQGGYQQNFNNQSPYGQPQYNPQQYGYEQPKKSNKGPIIIIGIVAGILLLCGVGGGLLAVSTLKDGGQTNDKETISSNVDEKHKELIKALKENEKNPNGKIKHFDDIDFDNDFNDFDTNLDTNSISSGDEQTSNEIEVDNSASNENAPSTSTSIKDGADVFNGFTFTLDGRDIALPTKVQDILDMGYTIDDASVSTQSLEKDQYSSSFLIKNDDGVEYYIRAINLSNETLPIMECNLYGISAEYSGYSFEVKPNFKLGNGCEIGKTTIDEFDSIFINPSYAYDSDTSEYKTREFEKDSSSYYLDNSVKYTFNDGVLVEIQMEYID